LMPMNFKSSGPSDTMYTWLGFIPTQEPLPGIDPSSPIYKIGASP